MDNSIYAALSGQAALKRKLDSIANNMANISTVGFKAEETHFFSVFEKLETDGRGVDFVHDILSTTNFAQGPLKKTDNNLDVAISGDAMLSVTGPDDSPYYTRDGRLSKNAEGVLIMTATGFPVTDDSGSVIQIPEEITKIDISNDGTISGNGEPIARLGVFQYDPSRIERFENGLYKMEQAPELAENVKIYQGFIENSNVNAVKTLTDMIKVQRAYEAGKNLMDSEDQRIKNAIARLGQNAR